GEVLADGADPDPDPPAVLGLLRGGDPRVQLREGAHLRDRDQVVPAEVPDLALDAALLVRALDARLAVERREPVMRPERGPPRVLDPRPALAQHLRHGRGQVVIPDL